MAKDKKTIKYEADISGFKKNIQAAENSIKTLNNQLKLNQAQLKGNGNSVELLGQRVEQLKEKYKEQTTIVENTRKEYEKAVEVYGENSKEAENLKNKLIQAETKQQSIANAIKETNNQLTLQTDKLIKAGSKMQDFGDSTKKVGDNINNIGNKVSIASAGVGALGVAAVKTSASFESSMKKVAATMGITVKEIENGSESYKILEEAAQKCGETTKYSASEAADALNYLALAGYDAKKSAEVLPKVLNLAAAGDLDLAVASDMVTDAMAALNLETKDLDRYINEMAKTAQKSNTSVAQLGEGTLTVAGTAKLANMSLETMNAELGILANNGIKGAEGGTHLRNIILSLTSPTDAAATALKNLGINVADNKGNIRDLNDIMSEFNTKLNGLSDEKKTNIISTIFNKTDISAVNALIKGSGEEFTNLKNEISNCGNVAQDMADVMNSSLEGQTTLLKSQIESIAITTGKKLMPTAKKAVDEISKLATSFSKLSDEQVESIVKTGAFVVALGPALKIGGKVISTIGSGAKSVGTLTKAIGVLKTGTKSEIKEVDSLAQTLTKLRSSAGVATIAVTGLVAALTVLAIKRAEAVKETKELSEETANARQSFEEYNKSIDDATNTNLAQINSASLLKDELATLVDENGKVKEGYESRVDFILNQLNEALGTEYQLNGNIVQSYKDLQSEIDSTIEKKKAETILNAEQEKYVNARDDEIKAVEKLKEVQDKLGMTYEEAKVKLQNLKDEADVNREGNGTDYWTSVEIENLENLISSYENTENEIKECTEIKKQYENDYALFVEGRYNEMGSSIIDTTKKWTDSSLEEIQNSIAEQKRELEENKNIYEKYGSEIAQQQMQQAQKNLENLSNELVARTKTVGELGAEEISAWKTLAVNSYDEYQKAILKVSPTMQEEIQKATGVVVEETPYAKQVAENYINSIMESLDKDEEFRKKAVDSLNGYLLGLSDEEKKELLKQAGVQDVDKVVEGFNEGRKLSEEEGTEILKGLKTGLEDNGLIISAINQARNVASRIAGALSLNVPSIISKASGNAATAGVLPGHKDGLDYVPYDNYVARLHKGERVLTAEENKKYTSENINNKLANNNITVQFFPQTMSNVEMEKAFTYIDKRYGKMC